MPIKKINPGDPISQSADLVHDNIDKLKALFPEIVTEGKIDFKVLQQVLGEELETAEEYYRFTWAGKSQARREAHKPSTGTLRPAKEESLDWDSTQNMYIEGDNLEVLKLLQKSYAGKIKMIYIDPPYNTGKDFVYKDNYKDNLKNYQELTGQIDNDGNKTSTNSDADGRYHSNWLNMMYPRLRLARNLLKEDGVIFMSIDDNEVDNLLKVSKEVFGEDSFITSFCWEKKKKPSFLNKNLGSKFEYILVFSKDRSKTGPFSVEKTTEGKKYPLNNAGNGLSIINFPPKSVSFSDLSNKYHAQDMSEGNIRTRLLNEVVIENGMNVNEFSLEGEWRYSQKKLDEIFENGEVILISKNPFRPNHVKKGGEIKKMHNLLTIKNYNIDTNEDAFKEQVELLGDSFFEYTKPSGLLSFLIKSFLYDDKNCIVLDFFAGSSTTAHGVIKSNLFDNGDRKYINIQLPEKITPNSKGNFKNIAEIGKERIRRVVQKIKAAHPEKSKEMDLGFKVFKLDSSNIKSWDGNPENLETSLFDAVENIKTDRTEEDVLYEILLKYGLDLTLPIEERIIADKKVFNVGLGSLFICLADGITAKVAEGIGQWKEACAPEICRVIFKDNGFTDVAKTNAVQTLKRYGINEIRSI